MSLATYSPETQIANGLRELRCAESNFALISRVVGKTRLAEGLSGQKDFGRADAEKMLGVLQDMRDLTKAIGVTPDWRFVEDIREVLAARREVKRRAENILSRARPAHREYLEKLIRQALGEADEEALEMLNNEEYLINEGWIEQ